MLVGISIGGCKMKNIRYPDNTVLVADSLERIQTLVDEVNVDSEEIGLKEYKSTEKRLNTR